MFRLGDRLSSGAKLVQTSALLCILFDALLIVRRSGGHNALDPLAVAVCGISGVVFAWSVRTTGLRRLTAVFSDDLPLEIIVSGPYRFVRNPFYLAYLLVYVQAIVASRSWWATLPLVWMGSIYYRAALLEEKKFLNSRLAPKYRRYIATTGRFLPMLAPRSRVRLQQSIDH